MRVFGLHNCWREANLLLCKIRAPSASSTFRGTISARFNPGENGRALAVYLKMQQLGKELSQSTIVVILKAYSSIEAIGQGRLIHSWIIQNGFESKRLIGNTLLDMYCKCGALGEARKVFDELPKTSVVTWRVMMAGYVDHECGFIAIEVFENMQQHGVKPSRVTFLCVLKACGSVGSLEKGRPIHEQIIRSGYELDVVVGSTLVDMYSKCGSLEEARKVFDELPIRDVVSWNAMIAGYSRHDQGRSTIEVFKKMQQTGIEPTEATFLCTLKACGSIGAIEEGMLIHREIIGSVLNFNEVLGSSLVGMYAKCGSLDEARKVFDQLPNQNVLSWSVMIKGYAQHGHSLAALELFEKMQQDGLIADKATFLGVLKACGNLQSVRQGSFIHDKVLRSGLESDVAVGSILIDTYAKCGSMEEAHVVFDKLLSRNVVSWGAMIAGYAQHGYGLPALQLYKKMQLEGVLPTRAVFLCALKACISLCDRGWGRLIHDQIIRIECKSDMIIESSLVDMYAKFGSMEEASKIFNKMSIRDIVSWNSMIAGYAQEGHSLPALELFEKMQQDEIEPDKVTFLCILQACGSVGAIVQGQLLHSMIIESRHALDAIIGSALVDMYARAWSIEEARKVFNDMMDQDVASWGALISGYAEQGNCMMAGNCLDNMICQGLKPDGKTYTSMLTACSHAGDVGKGHRYFKHMVGNHGIAPSIEHFNCIIDLLGHAGHLIEALKFMQTMPTSPDSTGWMSLLSACNKYGNMELGRQCFDQVMQLDPHVATGYVLMSNMFADANMWVDAQKTQDSRNCVGAWKIPGSAFVEIKDKVHGFTVGDQIHSYNDEICAKLERLQITMKESGHFAQLDQVIKLKFRAKGQEDSIVDIAK